MASRVTWGCVVSVKGLEDAKSHCNRDSNCQAFVVFSSNPEKDGKPTGTISLACSGFVHYVYISVLP